MTRLAFGIEEHIGHYLSAQFPELMAHGEYVPDRAVGLVADDGMLIGGIGLCFENAWDAQLSIHIDRPGCLTRGILKQLFGICFNEFNLVRLTCHIRKSNKPARKFVERLGFRLEGVKRRGFDGKRDAVIYGQLRSECRWL